MTMGEDAWTRDHIYPWLHLLARRWVLDILGALSRGQLRRGMLSALIPEASERMLTDTLRDLESHGLVQRTAIASVPVEVDYQLTELAESLWHVLTHLDDWTRFAGLTGTDEHKDDVK